MRWNFWPEADATRDGDDNTRWVWHETPQKRKVKINGIIKKNQFKIHLSFLFKFFKFVKYFTEFFRLRLRCARFYYFICVIYEESTMKMNKISLSISTALLAAGLMTSSAVNAQGRLVVIVVRPIFFVKRQRKRLAKNMMWKPHLFATVQVVRLQKLKREKNNPQADVWFGGTFDPQAQALN